jgi:hypothetical protein
VNKLVLQWRLRFYEEVNILLLYDTQPREFICCARSSLPLDHKLNPKPYTHTLFKILFNTIPPLSVKWFLLLRFLY